MMGDWSRVLRTYHDTCLAFVLSEAPYGEGRLIEDLSGFRTFPRDWGWRADGDPPTAPDPTARYLAEGLARIGPQATALWTHVSAAINNEWQASIDAIPPFGPLSPGYHDPIYRLPLAEGQRQVSADQLIALLYALSDARKGRSLPAVEEILAAPLPVRGSSGRLVGESGQESGARA